MGSKNSTQRSVIFIGKGTSFASIAEALPHAMPGTVLVLLPGIYFEPKEINLLFPIHIHGVSHSVFSKYFKEGTTKKISKKKLKRMYCGRELESIARENVGHEDYAVKLSANIVINHTSLIHEVHFSNIEFNGTINSYSMTIMGETVIEHCRFTLGKAGITVKGESTPIFRNVLFLDAISVAVSFVEGSSCEMISCSFSNCATGIFVADASNPRVTDCLFSQCGTALHVTQEGEGTFSSCTFAHNLRPAVLISNRSNPILRNCYFNKNASIGIFVTTGGCGVILDCMIEANLFPGMAICGKQGGPIIVGTTISGGKNAGVLWYERGRGIMSNCTIKEMQRTGIESRDHGAPIVSNCDILDDEANGVFVHTEGNGVFSNCRILDAVLPTVAVSSNANPVFHMCSISSGKDNALLVYDHGKGSFLSCDLIGHITKPVDIRDESTPLLHSCTLRDGKREAVLNWLNQIPKECRERFEKEESVDFDELFQEDKTRKSRVIKTKTTIKRKAISKRSFSNLKLTKNINEDKQSSTLEVEAQPTSSHSPELPEAKKEEETTSLVKTQSLQPLTVSQNTETGTQLEQPTQPSQNNTPKTALTNTESSQSKSANFNTIHSGKEETLEKPACDTITVPEAVSQFENNEMPSTFNTLSKSSSALVIPNLIAPATTSKSDNPRASLPDNIQLSKIHFEEIKGLEENPHSSVNDTSEITNGITNSGIQVSFLEKFLARSSAKVHYAPSFLAQVPTLCSSMSSSLSFTESSSIAPYKKALARLQSDDDSGAINIIIKQRRYHNNTPNEERKREYSSSSAGEGGKNMEQNKDSTSRAKQKSENNGVRSDAGTDNDSDNDVDSDVDSDESESEEEKEEKVVTEKFENELKLEHVQETLNV